MKLAKLQEQKTSNTMLITGGEEKLGGEGGGRWVGGRGLACEFLLFCFVILQAAGEIKLSKFSIN